MSDFINKTGNVQKKMLAACQSYTDTAGKKLEAEAKSNAKWEDRTGNARQTIKGFGLVEGGDYSIVLRGGMEYSVWLELARGKKYAILFPTIQKNQSAILKAWSERLLK